MTRILWHSNAPWAQTGYGSQTALFTSRIRDAGHDVAISAFWGLNGKAIEWDGMTVYPADDEWGNKWLVAYAMDHGQGDPANCQVITLMDVWVLSQPLLAELNLACWVPVDHDPVPPLVAEFFRRSGATPIAMSRFGQDRLRAEGLDALYVPHGVDTAILHPIDQAEVRAAMGTPADAFVVGMVAANKGSAPPRKAFPQVFEAFAEFQKRHPEALLYLHTPKEAGPTGVNLIALATACGVPLEALRFTPEFELQRGVEYEKMAYVYSNMDVLLSPSYGEGFGIPIIEAQACGVPVIVNDWTAMPELVGPGWLVEGDRWYEAAQGSFFKVPRAESIFEQLEAAYEGARDPVRKAAAREFALAYDVDTVTRDYWLPVLEQLGKPREVAPLPVRTPEERAALIKTRKNAA